MTRERPRVRRSAGGPVIPPRAATTGCTPSLVTVAPTQLPASIVSRTVARNSVATAAAAAESRFGGCE